MRVHGIVTSLTVRDGGADGDEEREQREGVVLAVGLDAPPDGVPAGAAGRDRRLPPERAVVAAERGEDDSALVRVDAGGEGGSRA